MNDRPLFCDHKHKIIKATENNISTSCPDCMTRFQWVSKSKLAKAQAEVERLKGFIPALTAINDLAAQVAAEGRVFDTRLREAIGTFGTESRKYGIRWGQRDVARDIHRRLSGLLKWHCATLDDLVADAIKTDLTADIDRVSRNKGNTCRTCGHADHYEGLCLNMASDNDCNCKDGERK